MDATRQVTWRVTSSTSVGPEGFGGYTGGALNERFQRPLRITRHARQLMDERDIDEALLLDLVETGTLKFRDAAHAWVFKRYAVRDDNLLCAAVLLEGAVIVQTVMNHFTPE